MVWCCSAAALVCVALICLRAQKSGTKWSAVIETQLCYEIKTFLLAGHETSAAMLMWSVYELGRNEQARQKVSRDGHVCRRRRAAVCALLHQDRLRRMCMAAASQEQRLCLDCLC